MEDEARRPAPGTPATRPSHGQVADALQLRDVAAAVTTFPARSLQRQVVQHGVGEHPLQPTVLVLQRLQPACLGDIQPAELRHALVEGRRAEPVSPPRVGRRQAGPCLRRIAMIRSSVNLDRFIVRSSFGRTLRCRCARRRAAAPRRRPSRPGRSLPSRRHGGRA